MTEPPLRKPLHLLKPSERFSYETEDAFRNHWRRLDGTRGCERVRALVRAREFSSAGGVSRCLRFAGRFARMVSPGADRQIADEGLSGIVALTRSRCCLRRGSAQSS